MGWRVEGNGRIASLGAVLALVGVAGCGRYGADREVVVTFAPTATQEQHATARQACLSIHRTVAEPMPSSSLRSTQINNVRFRVDKASDGDLAKLYDCLRRQPGVIGIDLPQD